MGAFDQVALERAFVRLERPVYNVVYRSLWSAEEAHDVVQEAFLRLWDMRARVRPDTVDPLVYRIALNLARNRRRWLRLRTFVGLGPSDADPDWSSTSRSADPGAGADRQLIDAEQERALRAAIDALPATHREVVLMTWFSGLSYREVGEALGIPEGTVGSRRTHALRALRSALGEPGMIPDDALFRDLSPPPDGLRQLRARIEARARRRWLVGLGIAAGLAAVVVVALLPRSTPGGLAVDAGMAGWVARPDAPIAVLPGSAGSVALERVPVDLVWYRAEGVTRRAR